MPKKARLVRAGAGGQVRRRRNATQHDSALLLTSGRDFKFGANVVRNLRRVEIHQPPDLVIRNAPELGPFAQGPNRGFSTGGKNPTGTQTDDVGELGVDKRSGIRDRDHT